MAFVDFSGFPPTLGTAKLPVRPLTQIERDVITLARRDPVASLKCAGALRGWVRWGFDVRIAAPLADPRLEELRCYAVLLRHRRGRVAHDETLRLVRAGYAPEQIAELRALVLPAARPPRSLDIPPVLTTAAMTASRIGADIMEIGPAGLVSTLWPLVARLLAPRDRLSPAAARA